MGEEKELLKEIISEDVEEEVYAGIKTTSTTYAKVASGTIPDGFEGIVMGIAVSFSETIDAFLKKKGKHVYTDGLSCAALTKIAQSAGVGDEVPLLVKIGEKESWEFGFKATAATPKVNWRIRVRHFKKGA